MLSFKRWLHQEIKYKDNYYLKDVLDEMIYRLLHWIDDNSELSLTYEIDSFKNNFYHLMYNKYLINGTK